MCFSQQPLQWFHGSVRRLCYVVGACRTPPPFVAATGTAAVLGLASYTHVCLSCVGIICCLPCCTPWANTHVCLRWLQQVTPKLHCPLCCSSVPDTPFSLPKCCCCCSVSATPFIRPCNLHDEPASRNASYMSCSAHTQTMCSHSTITCGVCTPQPAAAAAAAHTRADTAHAHTAQAITCPPAPTCVPPDPVRCAGSTF